MLLKDFYKVNSLDVLDATAIAHITINKDHEIFDGHFPGNPVTPGVCMLQIIKELTEDITGDSLFMASASNVKFMAIINPEKNPDLKLVLEVSEIENGYRVKNTTTFDDTTALKLSTTYTKKV